MMGLFHPDGTSIVIEDAGNLSLTFAGPNALEESIDLGHHRINEDRELGIGKPLTVERFHPIRHRAMDVFERCRFALSLIKLVGQCLRDLPIGEMQRSLAEQDHPVGVRHTSSLLRLTVTIEPCRAPADKREGRR